MKYFIKLSVFLFISALFISAGKYLSPNKTSNSKPEKRNIVFILSDDHRYDFFSREDHPCVKTPHLDKLSENGIWFNNAFVTTSVCQSSRNSIKTGLYAHALGGMNNWAQYPDHPVLFTDLLKSSGYKTAFLGKYGTKEKTDDPRFGFDHWYATTGFSHMDPVIDINGEHTKVEGYIGDILTNEAIGFIEENKNEPFFVYLAHILVHSPNTPAERHKDLFKDEHLNLPPSFHNTDDNYNGKPEWLRKARYSAHGVERVVNRKGGMDEFYRNICRTTVALDESVGQIMDCLKNLELDENTLVIYMSDNGYLIGEQGMVDKRDMHEPSIRIPLIMHCPELFEGGEEMDGFALNIDIAPTVLDAAGLAVPDHMHGRSLFELIKGASDWRTDFLYEYEWESYRPMTPTVFGLRNQKYSYMHYHGLDDINELYDMENDPDQMNNLLGKYKLGSRSGDYTKAIEDKELQELVRSFQNRMQELMEETDGDMHPSFAK